jgi:predicted dehydrogenase
MGPSLFLSDKNGSAITVSEKTPMPVSRRHFLSAAAAFAPKALAANDNIQIALIGAGGMGQGDATMASSVPGVKLVAACDIYDGRLERARELWGDGIFTTRDYREILNRKDIDAVIIGTPDHWHSRISIDAMAAGKDVYCEKPMIHKIGQGPEVAAAQKKTGRILQVGSQYASSPVFQKARDLMRSGAIGEMNMVEAWLDRNTAIGAWQYSIPPGASPANVDWDRFLGYAPKRLFEPIRLFRWRNYNDYGTGLAGDLYVHLLTGLHVVTGSQGPNRIYGTGGIRFWKDGRDAPDVMLALLDYAKQENHPEFNLNLRVNFVSGEPEELFGLRFYGSEGTMEVTMSRLTLTHVPRQKEPGYSLGSFSKNTQEAILKEYREKYPDKREGRALKADRQETFEAPPGANAHQLHHNNFYEAVRTRKPFFEDAVFGYRTAGPALLCNTSMYEKRICHWDPVNLVEKT